MGFRGIMSIVRACFCGHEVWPVWGRWPSAGNWPTDYPLDIIP